MSYFTPLQMKEFPRSETSALASTETAIKKGGDAYHKRCAVTGEKTLPVLEAAHIKPYSESGPNLTKNGLLLRSDMHILFDKGYMTVSDNHHLEVSRRIREEYENGKEYYAYHGKELSNLPLNIIDRPSPEFLNWHREQIYQG